MAKQLVCASTKERVTNDAGAVEFPCPGCGESIVRSSRARKLAMRYTCSCGFTGPN